MIKKHLLTCALAVVVLLGSKLFIYSTPVKSEAETRSLIDDDKIVERHRLALEVEKKEKYYSSLNFANEEIPAGIKSVDRRMKRNLNKFSYRNLQTHKLHRTAKEWFPKIVPILKKHGIPEDFKYMPLVESGLRSGTSHRGASGYWQFMPGTARAFGLKVNSKVDERQDILKSTEAAAKYLNALHDIFGNWTLVAAAYNMGEGGLLKSMRNQGKDNYYLLSLNAETSAYVYRLISMKEIIENPDIYGYLPASGKGMLTENISYQWELNNRL
ncbi:lytic transglycosylase domain-containing protein [Albibacterium sp.]|uniref:lytic transglycosylase domain-containing protein n=1 Tax=Albibacterium sp. TaxID=2952885 RepID=UPI002B7EE22D|nr:lytic transglycosylase domain-containing protein [Albibacterium sp.]HUH20108.1 lytic transglycosylase domain-containing protein [Albibacterium sp.]